MEPLSSQTRKTTDAFLSIFYFSVIWLPLIYAFISLSLQISSETLTSSFFYLLARSSLFGILQASLSVLLIATFSFAFGYLNAFYKLSLSSQKAISIIALFMFSLSPTIAALSLLNLGNFFKLTSAQGLSWIVACHFMMNALFVSFLFTKRLERFQSSHSHELIPLLKSLGTSKRKFIHVYLWPIFKNDFFSWAPQIFLWCFSSFAPVLLLSEGPHQSTPEILFYYSILNDRSGARIFCILLLNLFLGFFLNRSFAKPFSIQESFQNNNSLNSQQLQNSKASYFLILMSLFFFLPFLLALLQTTSVISNPKILFFFQELLTPLSTSFLISLFCFLLSFFVSFLCVIAKQDSPLIQYSNILSPPFILFAWLELGIRSENHFTSIFLVSAASFLSVFPWFYRQIKTQRDQLPTEWGLYCLSLGMTPFTYFRKILFPQHKNTLFKLAGVSSLWAFGEYAFSEVFFEKSETLPLYIDENLRRYSFDASSFGISLAYLGSFLIVFLILKSERPSSC